MAGRRWSQRARVSSALLVLLQAWTCAPSPPRPPSPPSPPTSLHQLSRADENCAAHHGILLEWWLPVGCDFSGFFVEMLGYLVPMMRKVDKLFLHLGKCSEDTLALLTASEAAVLGQAQANWQERSIAVKDETQRDHERTVLVQHATPCEWKRFDGERPKVVIGRTMTERLGIDSAWIECCSRVDEIWVPTEWAVDIFVAAGVPSSQLFVMPEGIDTRLFQPPASRDRRGVTRPGARRPFVFLSVFKWEGRKGMDILLDAFWTVFSRADNVVLRLRTYVPQWEKHRNVTKHLDRHATKSSVKRTQAWSHRRKKEPMPNVDEIWSISDESLDAQSRKLADFAKVELVGGGVSGDAGALSREQMRDMYADADSFVLPTRGEGWGLPVVEAMAMGLPVIVTNHSGPQSYMSAENAYPIKCTPAKDKFREARKHKGKPTVLIGGFAEPDFEHLMELLVRVRENPREARAKGRKAREDIASTLSSEAVSERMLQRMNTLLHQ